MIRHVSLLVAVVLMATAAPAVAGEDNVLIQIGADGRYTVWHGKGDSVLEEDELVALDGVARTGGALTLRTSAGPARAAESKHGVVITLLDAGRDRTLLVDRDACGGMKVWHSEGDIALSEDQLTDLVISALPAGGSTVQLGNRLAKAYLTAIGVVAVIWQPVRRPRRSAE